MGGRYLEPGEGDGPPGQVQGLGGSGIAGKPNSTSPGTPGREELGFKDRDTLHSGGGVRGGLGQWEYLW